MGNTVSDRKNARCYSLKFSRNTDRDVINWLDSQESIQGYIKSLIKDDMKKGAPTMNYITMDSFGEELPTNWEEIAAFLNNIIDDELRQENELPEYGELSPDGREIVDGIWEKFCAGEIEGCPAPEIE